MKQPAASWAKAYRARFDDLMDGGMPRALANRIARGEERVRQRLAGFVGPAAAKAAELICVGERDEFGEETVKFALVMSASSAPPNFKRADFTGRDVTFVHRLP